MITAVVAGAVIGVQSKPVTLLSNMMRKYGEASSFHAEIVGTISDGKGSVRIGTSIYAEKPAKINFKQVQYVGGKVTKFEEILSNGNMFFYGNPIYELRAPRPAFRDIPARKGEPHIAEKVTTPFGEVQTYAMIYGAGTPILIDRTPAYEVIIGRDADLFSAWEKWGKATYAGEVTYKGKKVDKLTGKFSLPGRSPSGVKYEILLSKNSDLLSYKETETYPAEISGGRREITVTYTYEIAVVVNPKLKQSVFDPALNLGKSTIRF